MNSVASIFIIEPSNKFGCISYFSCRLFHESRSNTCGGIFECAEYSEGTYNPMSEMDGYGYVEVL